MPATKRTMPNGSIDYDWGTVEAAEEAIAALPNGEYSLHDLMSITPEMGAAAMIIIGNLTKQKTKRQVRFQGDSGETILERSANQQPGFQELPNDWVYRVRDGVLTVERG